MAEKDRYLKKLGYFGKQDLVRLVKIFNKEEIPGTSQDLRDFLIKNYLEDIKRFFDHFNFIKGARFNHLIQVLCHEYPEKVKEVEKLQNSKQIILFLYENSTVDTLQDIINKSTIEKGRIKDSYVLIPESKISISEIKDKIGSFVKKWNSEEAWKLNIEPDENGENSIKLFFYVEKGKVPFRRFKFRESDISYETPEGLRVKSSLEYPIYIKSCEFQKIEDSNYKLIFSFSEEPWFKAFLMYVFRDYKLEKMERKYVTKLTSNVKTKLDIRPNPNTAREVIEENKRRSIEEIDRSALPKKRKKDIKKIVESIEYCSPRLKDEIRSGTVDFTWLANFDKCCKVIPSSVKAIQEMLDNIPESRERFFITIGETKKPVLLEKSGIIRRKNLSQDEEIGLKVFLGVEDAIKEIS